MVWHGAKSPEQTRELATHAAKQVLQLYKQSVGEVLVVGCWALMNKTISSVGKHHAIDAGSPVFGSDAV